MTPKRYFDAKRVLVTGGSSGIGHAIADELLAMGASVRLAGRSPDRLSAAAAALAAAHDGAAERISVTALDVTDAAAVERAVGETAIGDVDVLVNSAGVTHPGRFVELPPDAFRTQMETNYFGAVNVCRAIVPRMIAKGDGHVVNIGSLAGVIGIYGYTAYAASKFALFGFSQALRAELWPHGVRVSVAHPADTDTPLLAAETPLRPPETNAIAGTTTVLSAKAVARAVLRGTARGAFEIWTDAGSRALGLAQGVAPWLVRYYCDGAQRRARNDDRTRP